MPRPKYNERSVRKLLRLGRRTLAVTIPIELVEELNLKKGQRMVVKRKGSTLIIKDWKK